MLSDVTTSPTLHSSGRSSNEHVPAAITDVGCERELNEDRYAVVESTSGKAWIVCDGMGGALGGELAAQLAIDAIRRALESRDFASPTEALTFAIHEANRIIVLRRQNPAFSGMGTTVVGVLIHGDEVVISGVGDSRVYLARENEISQLTVDHTYVQDLVSRGLLDPKEALTHPQAHVLTKCLGADPTLTPTVQQYWIWDWEEKTAGDKLILCSDGLYSLVTDEEISEHVKKYSPQECCVQLVELAKKRGGYDNITVSVLPLGGRLREEAPAIEVRRVPKVVERVSQVQKTPLAPKQLFGLMGMLLALGMVLATFVCVLLLANS